jgi:hypothetical protein
MFAASLTPNMSFFTERAAAAFQITSMLPTHLPEELIARYAPIL